jgi:hypothetical protein
MGIAVARGHLERAAVAMSLFAFSPLTGQRVSRDARWTAATIGFLTSLTCVNCLVHRHRTFRRWQPGEWTVRLVHPGRRTALVRVGAQVDVERADEVALG